MKHHFLSFCLSTPWALEPTRMRAYAAVLARKYAAKDGLIAEVHAEPVAAARSAGPSRANNNIAVIPVYGTIVQRASQLGMCEGGTGCQDISSMLAQALSDDTVSQILLDIDSPGGSVFGVAELADEIRAARAQKPVVAIANSMAASAAYWIGCQAGEFYVTPGGQVGSIGVWTAHEDWSQALAAEGINVTLISAGKYKVEGNPYGPLDADGLAATQKSVDEYYGMFTAAVAKGRGVPVDTVRNGMGQGRVLGADDALAEKMVDGVMPMSAVIRKMQRDGKARSARGASSAVAAAGQIRAAAFTSARTGRGNVAMSMDSQGDADQVAADMDANGCVNCTNCQGCTDCTDCADCTNCTGCSGCTNCNGCTDCTDCDGCTNCSGGTGMSGMDSTGASASATPVTDDLARRCAAERREREMHLLSL